MPRRRRTHGEKICFVIAPIGDAESKTRKRSDQVLKHVIAPAVEKFGYRRCKPLVQLMQKGEQLPFDVAGARTIFFDHHDLDSVEEAKREIGEQVKALKAPAARIETPLSVSLDLQTLRRSEDPKQRTLADVLTAASEIRTNVASIEKQLSGRREIRRRIPSTTTVTFDSPQAPTTMTVKEIVEAAAELLLNRLQEEKEGESKQEQRWFGPGIVSGRRCTSSAAASRW